MVPVGPGPSLTWACCTVGFPGLEVTTTVRGGTTGAEGASAKYDGGGAGLGGICSYGGGSPNLFSIVASIV